MELKKQTISRNFGRFAHDYEAKARLQLRAAAELISQCSGFSGPVLDLGSGPGIIRKNSDWEVISLDISPQMSLLAGGDAVTADIENLPFADNSFANIISNLSLQWFANLQAALTEIHRVLRPHGKLAFSTFAPDSLKELRTAFAYMDSNQHLMEFTPVIKLFAMLKKSGFDKLVMSSQKISYNFPDMLSALRSIKNIGAGYNYGSGKGLLGRKYFGRLENIYRGICKGEVPLNWEVLYIHAEKC